MVNSKKKISKQSVAIIVLSLLLVLSMLFALTGAWFTDLKDGGKTDIEMGTVNISESTGAVSVTNDDTVDMPGDTIKVTGAVVNSGSAKIWVRYTLTHNYEGDDTALKDALDAAFSGNYVYIEGAIEAGANSSIAKDVVIPTSLTNAAQGATYSVTLTLEAVQWANNHASTCEAAFANAGFATEAVPARA